MKKKENKRKNSSGEGKRQKKQRGHPSCGPTVRSFFVHLFFFSFTPKQIPTTTVSRRPSRATQRLPSHSPHRATHQSDQSTCQPDLDAQASVSAARHLPLSLSSSSHNGLARTPLRVVVGTVVLHAVGVGAMRRARAHGRSGSPFQLPPLHRPSRPHLHLSRPSRHQRPSPCHPHARPLHASVDARGVVS